MFRVFGFGATLAVVVAGFVGTEAVGVVVFGTDVKAVSAAVVVTAGGAAFPDALVEPVIPAAPEAGVVVVVLVAEGGRLVSAVGSGGSGLDKTLEIKSVSPASD